MDREELHHLIDELPDGEISRIAALVDAARKHDRVAVQCLLAEEVLADPAELHALAEVDPSEPTVSLEDIKRRYNIT